MMARGQYGINFIDKNPIVKNDSVDYDTVCNGLLRLKTLGYLCKIFFDHITNDDMEDDVESLPFGVMMVETSGRKTLFPRQACAVESAVRR